MEEEEQEIESDPTLFQRFKKSISNIGDAISESSAVKAIASIVTRVRKSNAMKVLQYTVAAAAPIYSIVLYSLMIAGAFTPVGAAISVVVGVIGLASLAVGAVMDTLKVRRIRRLDIENSLLGEHRESKNIENLTLSQNPRLKNALFPEPKKYQNEDKKLHSETTVGWKQTLKSIANGILRYGLNIVEGVIILPIAICAKFIGKVASIVLFSAIETKDRMGLDEVRVDLKNQINEEKKRDDVPNYNSLGELRKVTEEQLIETDALRRLSKDKSYDKLTDAEIRDKFEMIKAESRKHFEAQNASKPGNIITRTLRSWGTDIIAMADPLSKYNDPERIKAELKPIPRPFVEPQPAGASEYGTKASALQPTAVDLAKKIVAHVVLESKAGATTTSQILPSNNSHKVLQRTT
jgi:hypothetical protein